MTNKDTSKLESLRREYEKLQEERRARWLDNLLKESILNVLAEQQAPPQAATPPAAPPAPPAPAAPDPNAAPSAPDNTGGATISSLIDSLNVIRGGKSLTDPSVISGIDTVFKSFTPEQQGQIVAALSKLAKAVSGEVQASEQPAPETQGVPAPQVAPPPPPAPSAGPPPAPAPPAPITPTGGG